MQKKYVVLLTVGGVLLLGLVAYAIWYRLNVGSLAVTSEQWEVAYSINGIEYTGSQTISKLRPGEYTVKAYETKDNYYEPTDYTIKIERGKTTNLEITLNYKSSNPDFSGVEVDPYSK